MKKKIASILLMLNFILSAAVSADNTSYDTQKKQDDTEISSIEKLNEYGIIIGTSDGNLEKERNVTRAEFVVMLMRIKEKKSTGEQSSADGERFKDVKSDFWAYDYINKSFDAGIAEGYGGYFYPSNNVKYYEGIKMLIDMIGYRAKAIQKGGYPWGYMITAQEKGINVKDKSLWNTDCTRIDAANMIYDALKIIDSNGEMLLSLYEPKETVVKKYYVSPYGRDSNDGSEDSPWKTLYRAAFNVKAGSMVILEDGEYYEERSTFVRYSGTKDAPIIFKARNPHKAKIIYPENVRLSTKFMVPKGVNYITLQDVVMTQLGIGTEDDASRTSDIIYSSSGDHCVVRGNKFYHAYEEALKFYLCSDILVENNIIYDTMHEAIDIVNCDGAIIRNNDLSEFGRIGFLGKGGARNMLIYNNYLHNKKRRADVGFDVGGSTDAQFCYDIKEGTGFESYNTAFFNNIIYSENNGMINVGFSMCSPKKAYIMNNLVVGTDLGYNLYSTGMGKGWLWNATVEDIELINNIFYNCKVYSKEYITPINFTAKNNLFYNTSGALVNNGNITADPMFVEFGRDWHLKSGSPAIGKGTQWPEIEAFGGGTLNAEKNDRDNNPYGEAWNIGPYSSYQ